MILFAIIILVLALAVYFGFGNILNTNLNSIAWTDKALQVNVENHEKELQKIYDDYKGNDGGFDAYESSIMLAKAIEYTWTDCYNICKDERELFTGFFLKNPIDFNKDMDCDNYPISSGDKVYPSIGKIKLHCYDSRTNNVDEWTVTAWGLSGNTKMCSNYKLSNEDNRQWGNSICSNDKNGDECRTFCDASGAGIDKVDWQADEMKKGKYGNIRIIYNPGGLLSKPEIIVKEMS